MKKNLKTTEIIERQFDVFCKKALHNELKDIHAKEQIWYAPIIPLDTLTVEQETKLFYYDSYKTEAVSFLTYSYEVLIENLVIAKAIVKLSQKYRDIILLTFFLEMKDCEVSKLMNITNSTFYYHKINALDELYKLMKEAKCRC